MRPSAVKVRAATLTPEAASSDRPIKFSDIFASFYGSGRSCVTTAGYSKSPIGEAKGLHARLPFAIPSYRAGNTKARMSARQDFI